jgi:hypothetical protein
MEFLSDHFTNAEAKAVATLILRKFLLVLCAIVRLEKVSLFLLTHA